jgi:hypothetical protein
MAAPGTLTHVLEVAAAVQAAAAAHAAAVMEAAIIATAGPLVPVPGEPAG